MGLRILLCCVVYVKYTRVRLKYLNMVVTMITAFTEIPTWRRWHEIASPINPSWDIALWGRNTRDEGSRP
jgi:hypothetical protein